MTQLKHAKHRNQVRIIAGTHRGRKLTFIDSTGLRPTPDSVREKLFNWLGQDLTGKIILDLFSGSGALGFESASRHALQVDVCEFKYEIAQQLKKTVQEFGLKQTITVYHQDGLEFIKNTHKQYHIIFLDPPFTWNQWETLFKLLENKLLPTSYIYLEAASIPTLPEWLEIYRQGKTGASQFMLLTPKSNDK